MGNELINILKERDFGLISLFWIIIIILIIGNIDKVLLLKSSIWGLFSNIFVFAKKKQVSDKVRGTILKSVKNQNIGVSNIIPNDLKVVWINEEKTDTFVKNNQVIVRVKQSSNPSENLVTAVSEYVNNGLLYNVRRYLNKDVMDASKILMTRKVIQCANSATLTYLDEKYIIPKLNDDIELKELYNDLIKIDYNGMFIGIMLNEFNKAGMSIYNQVEDPELFAESKEFMRYLYNIVIRISQDTSDLSFNRDYFKVAIFLSASNDTLRKSGITSFVHAISKKIDEGIKTIYIFGLGRKRNVAKQISEAVGNELGVIQIIEHPYKHISENGKRILGVFYECIICSNDNEDTL